MPLYLLYLAAAAIFAAAGWALWQYSDSAYSLVLLPILVVAREVLLRFGVLLMRIGIRRVGLVIVFGLMPVLWRRSGKRAVMEVSAKTKLYWRYARARWSLMPWHMRFLSSCVACVCMCVLAGMSGMILFLLTCMPASVTATLGTWLKGKIVPVLARSAAARGMTSLFPLIWVRIPAQLRAWCAPRYRKLFRWTIRRLVTKRRMALKRRMEEAQFIARMKQFS